MCNEPETDQRQRDRQRYESVMIKFLKGHRSDPTCLLRKSIWRYETQPVLVEQRVTGYFKDQAAHPDSFHMTAELCHNRVSWPSICKPKTNIDHNSTWTEFIQWLNHIYQIKTFWDETVFPCKGPNIYPQSCSVLLKRNLCREPRPFPQRTVIIKTVNATETQL